jgi:metal-dependent amidase/aminoacylase/carboxypeptidase family protein
MSGLDDILAGYESLRTGQEALYKDLHQHPELSHAEHRTATSSLTSRSWS